MKIVFIGATKFLNSRRHAVCATSGPAKFSLAANYLSVG
jgi:hypothetical protein